MTDTEKIERLERIVEAQENTIKNLAESMLNMTEAQTRTAQAFNEALEMLSKHLKIKRG
jgi:hypothetical protein